MHSNENRGSAAASPAAAEPATLNLPEATPWTGNWSHLIAAWLFGVVILAGLVTFIVHFGAIEIFTAKLRGANLACPRPSVAGWRPMSALPLSGSASLSGRGRRCRS